MKKVFAIALIASVLVACNSKGDKKETPDTTTVQPVEPTPTPADTTTTPVADSTAKPDSAK